MFFKSLAFYENRRANIFLVTICQILSLVTCQLLVTSYCLVTSFQLLVTYSSNAESLKNIKNFKPTFLMPQQGYLYFPAPALCLAPDPGSGHRPWPHICIYQPWFLICIYRSWPQICVYQPWPRICIYRPCPPICIYRPCPLIYIYRPWPPICVYRPWPQICIYRSQSTILLPARCLSFAYTNLVYSICVCIYDPGLRLVLPVWGLNLHLSYYWQQQQWQL